MQNAGWLSYHGDMSPRRLPESEVRITSALTRLFEKKRAAIYLHLYVEYVVQSIPSQLRTKMVTSVDDIELLEVNLNELW